MSQDKSETTPAEPEPVFSASRPVTSFWAGLTPEQKRKALEYNGKEAHGDATFSRKSLTAGEITAEIVQIAGKQITINSSPDGFGGTYYWSGCLPCRLSRDELIRDIERSQGPEWRK